MFNEDFGIGDWFNPTGDDFITGLLASFSALQLPSNFQQLAVLAKERTNAVSYAEIHEAVNERFSQLVQRVFYQLKVEIQTKWLKRFQL